MCHGLLEYGVAEKSLECGVGIVASRRAIETRSYVAEIHLFKELSALAVGVVTVLVVVVIPVAHGLDGAVKEPLPVENVVAGGRTEGVFQARSSDPLSVHP